MAFSEDELDIQFQTNVYGVVRVTKAVLPFMRTQRSGTIVNVSSIAGFAAAPSTAAYSMSKFAVEGMYPVTRWFPTKNMLLTFGQALSESLFAELKPMNIRVLLVEPGAFRTNFIGSHKFPAAGLTKDYEGTPVATAMGFFDSYAGKQPGDPAKGVQRILDVIQSQGMGQNKSHLLRLPLGTDCYPRMMTKWDAVRQNLEEMKEVTLSTAVDSD